MAGFGGTIKLQGEEAYRAALKAIAADLKTVAAEQKLTASTYDKTDTSLSALSKRSEDLKSKLDAQKAKWNTLSEALKSYQSQQDKNKATIQNVQTQLDKEKAKLEEIAKQYGTNSKEYQEQAKVVDTLEQQLKELNTQYDKNEVTLKNTQAALTSTEADMRKTGSQMEKLGKQAAEAGVDTGELGLAVDDAGKKAENAANGGFTVMKGVLADLASKVIQKAVEGLKQLASNVYEAGSNFDAAMSKVAAVSGAAGDDLDALTEKAKEMGASTKFSASEAAEAFNYMAMAGWKTEDMLSGIEGVLNLAAAAGSDLATTSDIVTDALTAMGYSAKDAGRLADVMAAASSNANTNVEMMGQTFQYAAPIIGSMGYNMEDAAKAIGLMANAGIKGEKAGTALRSVLTRLAAPPKECADALEKLGVSITDSNGKMKSLDDVMLELRKSFSGLSETQQTQYAKSIAGAEAMSGLLAIVNASEADYNKLSAAIDNSAGSAAKMAGVMQNNVAGKMTQLKSQLEGVYITIWNKVEPAVSKAISNISKALKNVNWDSFGKKAGDALGKVVDIFTWLLEHGEVVISAIKGVIAAFVVTKIVNFTSSMIGTITALNNAVKAAEGFSGALAGIGKAVSMNPVGLLIGVIAGVGTAIGSMIASMNDAEDAISKSQELLEEQTNTINENKDSWDELKKAQQEQLNNSMTQLSHITALKDELLTLVDANGKVKEGYEGRAGFILNQLNEALGTEYSMTDGIIQKYGELVDSIDGVIEKKKAEAILNSQQAAYEEAINKQAEAYKNLNQIESDYAANRELHSKLEEEYNKLLEAGVDLNHEAMQSLREKMGVLDEESANLEENYQTQLGLVDQYAYDIGTYEQNMALAHEGRYDEMTTATWDYVKDLQSAGDQQKAIIEEDIKTTDTQIKRLEKLWGDSGNEIYKTQLEAAKKQQQANYDKLKAYNSTTENELKNNGKTWLENSATVLSKLSDKKVEFKKTGEDEVQMFVDGVAQGKPMATKEAESITKDTLKKFDKKAEAEGAGKNVITGFTNGEGNLSLQNTAFATARNFASNILSTLKKKLGIASPSKETESMGKFLLQGLGLGVEKKEDSVLRQMQNFGGAVIDAMNEGLSAGVDTSAISQLQNAIPDEISANLSAATANSSTAVAQAESEYKSMVSAFKDALGQMKIEMDDQEMGSFIDKTVTRRIFS